jgi:hypothetical protein
MKLCISTVVDSKYANYIPLFCYAITQSYPEYYIQLFTHGVLQSHVLTGLNFLNNNQIIVTEGQFDGWKMKTGFEPISWRFLIDPKHYKLFDYVYITDIDMMIMPEKVELLHMHLNEMGETGLCYSNSLRNKKHWRGEESFTGLHFASKDWFKFTEPLRQHFAKLVKNGTMGGKREFDGYLLYMMTKRSGLEVCKKTKLANRHHGVHLGNFRLFKTMTKLRKRMNVEKCLKWQEWQRDQLFRRLCKAASKDETIKEQLNRMDEHCKKVIK